MNKIISKELLSEVLGFKIDNCWVDGSNVEWIKDGMSYINIYELAHKCKEWAIDKDFIIETEYEGKQKAFGSYCICRIFYDGDKIYDNYSECEYYQKEPEAIFKACQWILDNKDK